MPLRLLVLFLLATVASAVVGIEGTPRAQADVRPGALRPEAPVSMPALPPCPIPGTFRTGFETAARETALPLALLAALGETESRFRPDAVSPSGARGLLQLMPPTAAEVEVDPDHPASNVLGGARYLRRLLDRFNSTDLALAAYNAGPGAVERSGGAPSGQTLTYVANVTERWRSLVGCR